MHPHTLATPAPPQLWPTPEHEPHARNPPQPSATVPQFFPSAPHVVGVHPHTPPNPPPPQLCGAVHPPHETVRASPQLSAAVTLPQFAPRRSQKRAFDSGVQPHTFACGGVPPPQVRPVPEQVVPQLIVRVAPQRSITLLSPHELAPQLSETRRAVVSPTHVH